MESTQIPSSKENSKIITNNSITEENSKNENNSQQKPRQKIKYRINFSKIIQKFRNNSESKDEKILSHIECYSNILMLSPDITSSSTISLLSLISYFNYKRDNKNFTYYLNNKVLKYLKNQKGIEPFMYIRTLYRAADLLNKESNIIYAKKYIMEIDLLAKNSKITQNAQEVQNELRSKNSSLIQEYIDNFKKIFPSFKELPDEKYKKFKKLINDIISNNYNIDEEINNNKAKIEINNDDNYLYVVNKKWIIKAKKFLDEYSDIRENNIKCDYFSEIFEYNYFIDSYLNKKKNYKFEYIAFPGYIDNYNIIDFKDAWEDPKNEDENYFIKKNLELNKDYLLISKEDFSLLNQLFRCTNIIKRKKNINEFISIKGIIFDQRFSNEESNIYLRKRNIQIFKNSTIKEFKNKILRCVEYILKKNNTNNNDGENSVNKIGKNITIMNGDNSENNIEKNINNDNNKNNNFKNDIKKNININDDNNGENSINKIEKNITINNDGENYENNIEKNINNDNNNNFNNNIKKNINISDTNNGENSVNKIEKNITIINDGENSENNIEKNINNDNNIFENNIEKSTNNINDNNEYEISFFILPKNKKNILVEMCLAYTNKIKIFDSLDITKININDTDTLLKFLDNIQQKNYILLIEIFPKNDNKSFFKEIPTTYNNKYNCNICNKIISIYEKYECDICHYSIYCSQKCAEKSENHILFDQKYREILIEEFNLNNFFKKDLLSNFKKNNKKGLVGLKNLGNTCYMNSALQCLSNTYDLTKYFIEKLYEYEINYGNRLGSNGDIVKAYYKLINDLWYGNSDSISPTEFLKVFKKSKNFLSNGQQDSQEFLSLLLDQLHEDLNRISNKPYIELKVKQGYETDKQASERWWNSHKKREDSIIVDLFNGQFKSEMICNVCKKSSVTYDPFMFLCLPIPKAKVTLEFKIFSLEKCDIFTYIFKDGANISDLKQQAKNFINEKYGNECTVKIVELDKYKNIKDIFITNPNNENNRNNDLLNDVLTESNEIILYQYFENNSDKNSYDIYVYPTDNKKINFTIFEENEEEKTLINYLSYPFLFQIPEKETLDSLQKKLIERLKNFFVENFDFNAKENLSNPTKILDLNYKHSIPKSKHRFSFTNSNKCDFCKKKKQDKPYCSIFNKITKKNTTIKKFIQKYNIDTKSTGPLIFYATSEFFDENKKIYNNLELFSLDHKEITRTKKIVEKLKLENLLDLFGEDIKFEEDNKWYCPNCKKHQIATQKLKIYKAPNYLIIQLKRFKIKKNLNNENIIMEGKNMEFVDYTINNFDLSNYVVGEEKEKAIYDLYGVIQHFGKNLNGGHYTAICKIYNSGWREFNDSQINKVDEIVTPNAYLLFYKRRGLDK